MILEKLAVKFFIWSMLMLTVTIVSGQDTAPILTASKPQKGIYRDFLEFLNNAPSIQTPFIVICNSGIDKIERGTGDYRVMLLDTITKRRDLKKFWGVYDGDALYINEVVYGGPLNFKKIHGIGRYCYFKGSMVNNSSVVAAGVAGGLVGAALVGVAMEIDGDHPYVLNMNNGKVYLLNKETLRTILKKDKELSALYDEEEKKSKKNTLLSYIIKYNERHQGELRYNRPEPISVTFYRREKKENVNPIELNVGDNIKFLLEPNSIKQVSWNSDSLDVCIGSNCRTIPLQKKVINYVECTWKSEQQEFKKVDNKVGEFYVREIRVVSEGNR